MPEDVAEQILQMCRVPDEPSVYVLGTLARTVNFRAQQIRAHNLAWALNSVEAGEIAVIGGGVSGATFAMAAQRLGFVVTLFERHEKILSIQAQNHTRYIHPTIALWPFERLSSEKAGVPFLNWSEDLVRNVIAEMRRSWDSHGQRGEIKVIPFSTCRGWNRNSSGQYYLRIEEAGGGSRQSGPFKTVVLATGFGLDGEVGRGGWCYWNNDYLDDTGISTRPTTWLVSGCGDGGLIDALRLKLTEFRNGNFLYPLLQNKEDDPELEKFRLNLVEIETQGVGTYDSESDARANDVSIQLQARYQGLKIPSKFVQAVEAKIRKDTTVYLNGRGPNFQTPNASVLNRVLLHFLESKGFIEYIQGSMIDVKADGQFHGEKLARPDGWKITFQNGALRPERRVDALVIRHGPKLELDSLLGSSQLSVLRSKFAINPDPTTVKSWKSTTFAKKSAVDSIPQESAPHQPKLMLPTEGWRVSSDPSLQSYCSVGFAVKMRDGRLGFITVMFGKTSATASEHVFFGPSSNDSIEGIVIAETKWNHSIGFQVIAPTLPEKFPESVFLPAKSASPKINSRVQKLGATSGLTSGTLSGIKADMVVETVDGRVELHDQFVVSGGSYFSRPGDAGAGVMQARDNTAIGILVGGSSDGKMAVVFPIDPILQALDCSLLVE